MSVATRAPRFRKREVLVGSREQPERLAVGTSFFAKRLQLLVGAVQGAAARERQATQLPQPDIVGPLFEGLLDGVIGKQRLPHAQQTFDVARRGRGFSDHAFVRGKRHPLSVLKNRRARRICGRRRALNR